MRPPTRELNLQRPATLAGVCYPADAQKLVQYVRRFWDAPGGAIWGAAAKESGAPAPAATHYLGVIAPHIDLRVAADAYSHAFDTLRTQPPADTYLILGVGHHAMVEWSMDVFGYETPLGHIPCNVAAVKEIVEAVALETPQAAELLMDTQAHAREHSIEFPLICLQAMRALGACASAPPLPVTETKTRKRGKKAAATVQAGSAPTAESPEKPDPPPSPHPPFTFIPILCGGLHRELRSGKAPGPRTLLGALARALRGYLDTAAARGERVHIITSIDGCHQGPRFDHDYLVTQEVLADTKEWEEELWGHFSAADFPAFFRFLARDCNERYFDGVGAMSLLLFMFGDKLRYHPACWRASFDPRDASAVSFSSGWLELADAR
ncbi:AmmeMemoRadiSam system protein B [Verrucomicrobia bacterium LW23]|nr:AmmeMemoRadiSam system protein B [Verrucomicrobia bacterium LW23]